MSGTADIAGNDGKASATKARLRGAGGRRRLVRLGLMAGLPLLLAAGGGYFWVTGGRYQETENANLRQARVPVSATVSGRIVEAYVADNLPVSAGSVLFRIDPHPYAIAFAQAEAALASARLEVERLRAAYGQATAQVGSAESEAAYFRSRFERAADLAKKGVSAASSLDEARNDLDKATQQLAVARQGAESAKAALGGDPDIAVEKHPAVLAALAAREKAAFDLEQTTVRAPADGVVYQASSFKPGQYVAVGAPLFSLVETADSWIEANFKETQVGNMKPGQKAEVTLDAYPGRTFHATVEAIGAGTGAEFSLLPAQNATGNWVKVTQRIPVRLKLDGQAAGLAMRTGMSASIEVDTGRSRGLGLFGGAFAAEQAE